MQPFLETRLSLIVRLKNRADQAAWQEFVEIYRPVIMRLAASRGMQHADAEDLAQQVLVSVSKAIGRWEIVPHRARFRTWLRRVVENAILNALSRGAPDRAVGEAGHSALVEQQAARNGSDSDLLRLEYRREVFRWAARLIRPEFQPATWKAFWLTAIEDRAAGGRRPVAPKDDGGCVCGSQPRDAAVAGKDRGSGGGRGAVGRETRNRERGHPMSEKQTLCDPRRIELFLEQQLSDDEQAAFEEHLSECETCRRALDARAADAGAWLEARESLGSDDSFAIRTDGPDELDGFNEPDGPSQGEVTDEGPLLRPRQSAAVDAESDRRPAHARPARHLRDRRRHWARRDGVGLEGIRRSPEPVRGDQGPRATWRPVDPRKSGLLARPRPPPPWSTTT